MEADGTEAEVKNLTLPVHPPNHRLLNVEWSLEVGHEAPLSPSYIMHIGVTSSVLCRFPSEWRIWILLSCWVLSSFLSHMPHWSSGTPNLVSHSGTSFSDKKRLAFPPLLSAAVTSVFSVAYSPAVGNVQGLWTFSYLLSCISKKTGSSIEKTNR